MPTKECAGVAIGQKSGVPSKEEAEKAFCYLMQCAILSTDLMWKRSNIMLIIQGSILALIMSPYFSMRPVGSIAFCLFGFMISFFWWRITKGGDFWVTCWESKLRDIEEYVIGDHITMFRSHAHMTDSADLRKHFKSSGYVSTRKTLMQVSKFSMFIWILLLGYFGYVYHSMYLATKMIST